MPKYKNLIVGAGLSGATLARMMANAGESVVVIDAKEHIGGNCYDYEVDGIMVHKYGTHIFHTANKEVWDFLSQFTKWYPYQHKVLGLIDGQLVPIPFNLNSLHSLFPKLLADKIEDCLIEHFGFNKKVPILELRKTGNKDLEFLANYIYEKVFLEYTMKQWGQTPEDIDPSVTGRVPIYISRDDRYFQDKYQGIPLDGFTAMIKNMLKHPNIDVKLETPYSKNMQAERLFYTGAIDEFFDYALGELPYRSERFDFVKFAKPYFQDAAVVNYPCNYDWTRIGEYKWFLDNQTKNTIVSFEYPEEFHRGKNERYYPIVNDKNIKLYSRYLAMAQAKDMQGIYFLGRLGDYKYYDMDKAVARAMALVKEVNA
ncbi:MAG: UDP-galactopyranose mutase [Campylobacteraceae bacterium]|jgi:UDP-galactopyranose mutase|nr:UDP-galactopyranose mutase [Campylobacteraceae bacterium]